MPAPHELWAQWILAIAADKDMDLGRLLRHLQVHVRDHIPNADADPGRWRQWLAGTYNLLGILSGMVGAHPGFELGVGRLFQKWRQHPFDHTPPPAGTLEVCRTLADATRHLKKE